MGDPRLDLSEEVRRLVESRGFERPAGPIRLLTHLRYFGYLMNPVSFFYCFDNNTNCGTSSRMSPIRRGANRTVMFWGQMILKMPPGIDAAVRSTVNCYQKTFTFLRFCPWKWHTAGRCDAQVPVCRFTSRIFRIRQTDPQSTAISLAARVTGKPYSM